MPDRQHIEQALLADPFNADLRGQYADILLSAGEHEPAMAQYLLLQKQNPDNAAGFLGHALALHALGRTVLDLGVAVDLPAGVAALEKSLSGAAAR